MPNTDRSQSGSSSTSSRNTAAVVGAEDDFVDVTGNAEPAAAQVVRGCLPQTTC